MIKVRFQGTKQEILWIISVLKQSEEFKIIDVSKPFSNKGTEKYFRVYGNLEKTKQ